MFWTSIVSEPEEFFSFLFSGKYKVEYFNVLNNKWALLQWKYRDVSPLCKSNNIFIAAFATTYARFKLYSYLNRLYERVRYMDTDPDLCSEGG